jgi:hypothetical protein
VPVPAAAAVVLNATVTETGAPGFLTLWPADAARPLASTLNFLPGASVPNGTIVRTDALGRVAVFNGSAAPVHVVVDTVGWVPRATGFEALVPTRVLDTREPRDGSAPLLDGTVRQLDILGRLGLPPGTRGSVAVNLTVTEPAGSGWLRAWPSGSAEPTTSNLNFTPGLTVANSAVLGLGPGGGIALRSFGGPVHVVVDVTGLFPVGRGFVPLPPVRLVDTRLGFGPVSGSAILDVAAAAAAAGAPLPGGLAGAYALNVTVTEPRGPGWALAWPASDGPGAGRPFASSVNFGASQTVANTVVVGVGRGLDDTDGDGFPDADSAVGIHVNGTAAHLVVDLTGWFPADGLGLVADAQEARRYSVGEDRVAVILCHPPTGPYPPTTVAAVVARLGEVGRYYREISGDRYRPAFTVVGQVPQRVVSIAEGDDDCMRPAQESGLATGYEAMVVTRHEPLGSSIAYGFAGPGVPCREATCSPGTVPTNGRDGLVTLNTILGSGSDPYWFVVAHEVGHLLAWPHSFAGTGSEYDNPVDLMSRPPQPQYQPRSPQLPLAVNRFAAGWLDPAAVVVHRGNGAAYVLGPIGSGAPELLVVPGTEPGAFVTLEARAATGWDAGLTTAGVAVHRVDQRDGSCRTAVSQNLGGFGLRRCTLLERRQQQLGPAGAVPDSYQHVLGVGSVLDLGGVTVRIGDAGGGRYRVEVAGAAAVVPRLNGLPTQPLAPGGLEALAAVTDGVAAPAGVPALASPPDELVATMALVVRTAAGQG